MADAAEEEEDAQASNFAVVDPKNLSHDLAAQTRETVVVRVPSIPMKAGMLRLFAFCPLPVVFLCPALMN